MKMKQLFFSMLTLLCCTGAWAQSSDVLSGEFTINASGDKVHFSKGNLQKVDGNYQFAEHQYEYFGTTQSANHCDLFAFNNYQTPDGDFLWRILSKDEWGYLITERSVNNTLSEGALYSKATIGGVYKGVIVFPDNYTHPEGTGFSGSCNNGTANYTSTVSLEGWAKMEAAGCVFLPAAGYGYGYNDIRDVNSSCLYASSTRMDSDHRYTPGFYSDKSALDDNSFTSTLIPVRYVQLITNIQRDEDGYWLIGSVQDWKDFADFIKKSPNINAKMTADIDLGDDQTTLGPTEALAYKGTYDGQGYTLTVNISSTADICAPFRYVGDGAVIKNLHIAGTVNGAHRRIGGLVGEGKGTYSINNCISSVTINTTYNGDGIQGGFVASQRGTLQISDCIFDGVFYGPNAYTWGGIVGWKYNTTSISNCLVLCDSYNVKMTDVATFIPNDNNITNCYYKTAIGKAQGTQASAEQLADGTVAYRLQAGRTDMFWGQRIGTDTEPVLTNDESYRVYRSKNGGYTNDPTLAYEGLQKDADGNYLLGCVWDWQDFAALVNGGTTNINARMTADIDLGDDQTMIGDTGESTSSPCFSGIFDGQGYTLTVAYTGIRSSSVGAPFAKINGATIKNLHVKGSLSSAGYHPTSIVSDSWGTSRLEKVWGEVDITGTRTGWVEASGLVGCMKAGNLTIEDCLFTGTVNGSGSYNGCFIGYIDSGSATITNSLSTGTFSYSGGSNGFRGTHTNCYVKQFPTSYPSGVTKPTDEELADGTTTTALNNGRSEVIWVQDVLTNQPQLAIFANKYETTGIANLNVDANDNFDANAPMYNLAGQRVGKSYKGIVVVNGKKVLIK